MIRETHHTSAPQPTGYAHRKQVLDKRSWVYLMLSGVFITNALLAELIGPKIFSVEKTLQLPITQFWIWPDGFNLSAGVVIWPVVFIISDIINEYYGKKGLMRITYTAMALIAYTFLTVYLVTLLSPADFWLSVNAEDDDGNPFNINFAFNKIYLQSINIIFASLTAFALGQLLDAVVFQQIKRRTGGKMIWLRATASTVVSQLVDSFLILFLAFWVLGNWKIQQVLSVGITQYAYKMGLSILLIPMLYLVHGAIDRYLGLHPSASASEAGS